MYKVITDLSFEVRELEEGGELRVVTDNLVPSVMGKVFTLASGF